MLIKNISSASKYMLRICLKYQVVENWNVSFIILHIFFSIAMHGESFVASLSAFSICLVCDVWYVMSDRS